MTLRNLLNAALNNERDRIYLNVQLLIVQCYSNDHRSIVRCSGMK